MNVHNTYQLFEGELNALSDHILVINMENGERKSRGGIVIMDDNMTQSGVRPRWAQVFKVGSRVDYLSEGEWVLIDHGRWTQGVTIKSGDELLYLQRVDPNGILMAQREKPEI